MCTPEAEERRRPDSSSRIPFGTRGDRSRSIRRGRHVLAFASAAVLAAIFASQTALAAPEEVAYATSDAFRILASYYRPESRSTAAIVILPDPKEGRGAWGALAESLRTDGFHVLVPDLRGTGQSVVQRGVRRDRARFTRSEASNAGLDAEAALRYLVGLPDTGIGAVALIASGNAVMALPGTRNASTWRSSRILISPSPDEGSEPWTEAMRSEADELLVIVTSHDLNGIDVAATLIPKDGSKECWIVEGTERGPALLLARSELLGPLSRWIRKSLSSP
jgi:hypothetical protein